MGFVGFGFSWWMDGVVEGWQVRYGVLRDCTRGLIEREDPIGGRKFVGTVGRHLGGTRVVVGLCSA